MMNATMQSLIRAVLKVGGGYLVAKGLADESTAEVIVAGLVALIGVVWGAVAARKAAVG
jgi:drug/metabolite transporter superfamily protein YnfA